MGCNCGKNKKSTTPAPAPRQSATGQKQSFRLDLDSGESFEYGSALEARAALVRAGRRGSIRQM